MHRHTTPILAVLLAAAALIAGCTSGEPGDPRPAESTTPSADETPSLHATDDDDLPSHGAPGVDDPIDTAEFEQDPCRILADAQVQQAGLTPPGKTEQGAVAPACAWQNLESGARLGIQFENSTRLGLSGAYQTHESDPYGLWLELPAIDGYPAVAASTTDRRANGECTIIVGTSNEVTFDLAVALSKSKIGQADPCDAAQQVAGLALETMTNG